MSKALPGSVNIQVGAEGPFFGAHFYICRCLSFLEFADLRNPELSFSLLESETAVVAEAAVLVAAVEAAAAVLVANNVKK